jgi:hypothetical protein
MSWTITPALKHPAAAVTDPDARTYLLAVEQADGQFLESGVATAINTFVTGCKADGIWNAIKASCILAGARTLNGALVPLAGTAPTNFNFVAGDYDRKTGLVGDGSTKYLNSNTALTVSPANNTASAVWHSATDTSLGVSIGVNPAAGADLLLINQTSTVFTRCENEISSPSLGAQNTGFMGVTRSSSANYTARFAGANTTVTSTSVAKGSLNIFVFTQNNNGSVASYSDARLAFYSIGESLDLALLDARVTDLINAFAAAIPS